MTRKVLIFMAICLVVFFNCSKKTTTNNYYSTPGEGGAIVGIVSPAESNAKVSAYLGIEIASTQIDKNGYFKLSGLPDGTYSLLVQAEGYFDYQSKANMPVTGGVTVSADTIFLTSIHDLILSVWPSDGAEQVRVSERIRIRFRTEMNTESVESAFHLEPEVEGDFTWYYRGGKGTYGSTDLYFIPRGQFATNTCYQVTIDTTASDTAGIKLLEPYQFSFTTEPIRIEYTSPGHNDTWVSPSTNIYVYFNTDMDMKSVDSAFKMMDSELIDVMGNFVWSNRRQMRFYPNSALAVDETYTVTIDTMASNTEGEKLSEPYQFSFTTQPLRIEYTSPSHKDTWVSPSTNIRISFNTDMDTESVSSAFKMVDSELKDVTGEFAWHNLRSMYFYPDSTLATDETYTVTIDTSAKDTYGSTLDEAYSFWFKTRPD